MHFGCTHWGAIKGSVHYRGFPTTRIWQKYVPKMTTEMTTEMTPEMTPEMGPETPTGVECSVRYLKMIARPWNFFWKNFRIFLVRAEFFRPPRPGHPNFRLQKFLQYPIFGINHCFWPKIGYSRSFWSQKLGGRGGLAEKSSACTKNIRKFFQKSFHGADDISGRYTYVKVPKTVV